MSDSTTVSHHNGLGPTLEILEKIYRNPTFPLRTPEMETSLFDQGISRADLWAFATISAIEYGIDMNNIMCDDPTHLAALDTYNYPYDSGTSSSHFHYNIHHGETDCKVPIKYTHNQSSSLVSDSKTEFQVHHWTKCLHSPASRLWTPSLSYRQQRECSRSARQWSRHSQVLQGQFWTEWAGDCGVDGISHPGNV